MILTDELLTEIAQESYTIWQRVYAPLFNDPEFYVYESTVYCVELAMQDDGLAIEAMRPDLNDVWQDAFSSHDDPVQLYKQVAHLWHQNHISTP